MLDFGLARQFTNSNQEVRPVSALCHYLFYYYDFFFKLKTSQRSSVFVSEANIV